MEQETVEFNHHGLLPSSSWRRYFKGKGYDLEMREWHKTMEVGLRPKPIHNKFQQYH